MNLSAKLFAFLMALTPLNSIAQAVSKDYIQKWENAKTYTLSIAEAMPDSLYNASPTEGEMSFAEQLKHLNQNMLWLHADFITPKNATALTKLKENIKEANSKKEIIASTKRIFDLIIQNYATLRDKELRENIILFGKTMSRNQVCLLAIDHLSHHRGQCAVYLRINNIIPPKYIGY